MPPDEPARPAPVVLRIKLRYEDVDTMVHKFAPNVGKAGLFLPTKSMQPIGTEVKFELRLANDTAVIVGLGKVKVAREPDPANPKATFGIGIELMRVTRESRDLILRMLERRRQLGLVESAVPMPDDIDAARRQEVDTAAKADAVATAIPPVITRPRESEPLLTAPRRTSGPIAVVKDPDSGRAGRSRPEIVLTPLAPEPSRRHVRKSVTELIASVATASAPLSGDMFGSTDEVDVKSVLSRARALAAGTDLDAELEALREMAAAPLAEISIEAASAELARQLGGKPVDRKNRSARWEMPPPSAPIAVAVPESPKPDVAVAPETALAIDGMPVPGELAAIASPHKSAAALVLAALIPERVAAKAAEVESAIESAPLDEPLASPTPDGEASFAPDDAEAVGEDAVVEEDDIHELDDADVHEADDGDDEAVVAAAEPAEPAEADDLDEDPRAGYIRDDAEEQQRLAEVASHAADEAVAAASIEAMAAEAASEADDEPAFIPARTEPFAPSRVDRAATSSGLLIDDHVDPAQFEAPGGEIDPALEQALQQPLEAHAEFDLDAADESTQFGVPNPIDPPTDLPGASEVPDPEAFDRHAYATEPASSRDALADSLEQQLAEAEASDDFGFGETPEEIDDFEILAEADVDEADLALGDLPGPDDFVSRLELSTEHGAAPDPLDDFSSEHSVDPLADPLAGFRDSLPSYSDIAPAYQAPHDPLAGFSDEQSVERGHAGRYLGGEVPAQPTWDPVSGSYTFANVAPPVRPPSEFDEPHSTGYGGAQAFDESDIPTPPVPAPALPAGRYRPAPAREDSEDGFDLENALEALDVDLDELSIPPGKRTPAPVLDAPTANRRDRLPRAASEDGIEIDFDDD